MSFYLPIKFIPEKFRVNLAFFCEKYLGASVQADFLGDMFTKKAARRFTWRKMWLIWDIKNYSFFFRII